jgi:hypothetical protein
MVKAKRARTVETPKQPSFNLRLRAPYFYPDLYVSMGNAGMQINLDHIETR